VGGRLGLRKHLPRCRFLEGPLLGKVIKVVLPRAMCAYKNPPGRKIFKIERYLDIERLVIGKEKGTSERGKEETQSEPALRLRKVDFYRLYRKVRFFSLQKTV
jgi:hypothetical protein